MLTGGSPVIQELYGIHVRTPWPVHNVPATIAGAWDVEFIESDSQDLAEAAQHVPAEQAGWSTQTASLPDGSRYCRWTNLFEFLVPPDGRHVHVRVLKDASLESLQACLLVDALSFSLIRLGREPLHATAVLTDKGVVAFLGKSGDGKSTLGALFVNDGCPMVADDMLVLTPNDEGYVAHPGPPRIKLYRDIAQRIFGKTICGVPMNPATEKLIIPLENAQAVTRVHQLRALYVICHEETAHPPRHRAVQRLTPAQALPRALAACASHWQREPERLRRQFEFITRLVVQVPITALWHSRRTGDVRQLRDAVMAEL